jgi:SHS2 domain-containing protein
MHVRAADLAGLFAECGRGMTELQGIRLAPGPRVPRTFETTAGDTESLLVAFLSELVFAAEHEKMAFDRFHIEISGKRLKAGMSAAPILSMDKAIKAVTYHNLQIQKTEQGYEVEIVFDV